MAQQMWPSFVYTLLIQTLALSISGVHIKCVPMFVGNKLSMFLENNYIYMSILEISSSFNVYQHVTQLTVKWINQVQFTNQEWENIIV